MLLCLSAELTWVKQRFLGINGRTETSRRNRRGFRSTAHHRRRDIAGFRSDQESHRTSVWGLPRMTGGLLAKIGLGSGFTLVSGLDLSVDWFSNDGGYSGGATALQRFPDGLLLDWHTGVYLVAPNIGLLWKAVEAERRISVAGHASCPRFRASTRLTLR
jgi:hypothetical protein